MTRLSYTGNLDWNVETVIGTIPITAIMQCDRIISLQLVLDNNVRHLLPDDLISYDGTTPKYKIGAQEVINFKEFRNYLDARFLGRFSLSGFLLKLTLDFKGHGFLLMANGQKLTIFITHVDEEIREPSKFLHEEIKQLEKWINWQVAPTK